jgi:glycosyltransferase 2 family protein
MCIESHLWNRKTKEIIKVLLSFLVLFCLFRSVHPAEILSVTARANIGFLVSAVLCQVASNLLAGFRWCLTMNILDIQEPPSFYVKSFFKAAFFNQVLPGSIGGDGIRMLDVKVAGYGVSDTVDGVIIDRSIGLLCLLLICFLGTLPASPMLPGAILRGIRGICVSGIVLFGAFAVLSQISILKRIACISFVLRISEKIWRVFSAGGRTGIILALSVVVHIFAVLSMFLISLSTGENLSFLLFLAVFPSAVLLTVLPVSFAGWGVREGALVALFISAGVEKGPVLIISILYGFVLIIASLPGLFFWLLKRKAIKGLPERLLNQFTVQVRQNHEYEG